MHFSYQQPVYVLWFLWELRLEQRTVNSCNVCWVIYTAYPTQCTIHPIQYIHFLLCVVLWFSWSLIIVCDLFTHNLQDCFTGTGAIVPMMKYNKAPNVCLMGNVLDKTMAAVFSRCVNLFHSSVLPMTFQLICKPIVLKQVICVYSFISWHIGAENLSFWLCELSSICHENQAANMMSALFLWILCPIDGLIHYTATHLLEINRGSLKLWPWPLTSSADCFLLQTGLR